MNNPGVGEIRRDSWINKIWTGVYTSLTLPNVAGVVGTCVLLFLFLVPPLPWNIRLPVYLGILVWAILRPQIVLYLLPWCVPWGSLDYIDIGPLRVNSADILVLILGLVWLVHVTFPAYFGQRQKFPVPLYLILAMLAFLACMILSIKVAINVKDSLKEISKWLEVLVIVLLGSQYIRTRRQIWLIVALICIAGMTQAIFGYLQYSLNLGPQSFIRAASLRVYGTFDQPNPYAGYINLPLSITLALTLLGRDWLTRVLTGCAAAILLGAELLSQSRGGEIALIAALTFIVLAGFPQIRVFLRVVLLALLAFVEALLLGWIPTYLFTPFLKFLGLAQISLLDPNTQDFSTAERLAHWLAGLHMFFAHPILGVGIGNYPDAYTPYHIANFLDPLGHAHNIYINFAAETGSIGLAAYLLFLLAIFCAGGVALHRITKRLRQAKEQKLPPREHKEPPVGTRNKIRLLLQPAKLLRYYRQPAPLEIIGMLTNDRALAIGLLAALITLSAHNLVDDMYVHSIPNLMALLIIVLIRLERVTPKRDIRNAEESVDYAKYK